MKTGVKFPGTFLLIIVIMVFACKHSVDQTAPATGGGSTGGGSGGSGGGTGSGTGGTITCNPDTIYFQQQVLPLLISNCAMSGCHDDASHQDGVVLTSYEKIINTGDVRPGRPNDSELYERITDSDPDDRMPRPPRSPLSAEQIGVIRKWIEQGAKNLSCQSACDANSFTYSGTIKNIISNKCLGCHSGAVPQAGIDLSTYNGLKAKVTDGRLWGAINHLPGFSAMPKNGNKLSDCEIQQVRQWIDTGSPNN